MTYAVVSDIHAHAWSVFSTVTADGINSRLAETLAELERAANEVLAAGGRVLIVAGDIFHVRGTIDPEVLNPLQDCIKRILDKGVLIYAIPGNHDLKSKETSRLSSAVETLSNTSSTAGQFVVVNACEFHDLDGQLIGFVPWRSNVNDLLADLDFLAAHGDKSNMDVFIHAGIDGVLPNMPAHGLTDVALAKFGFRHVFAGHYHNHKQLSGGVVSIGATTHHNWGDVGSKAGFLLVDDSGQVKWFDTQAPKFIDITGMDEDDIPLACPGNYVRFSGPSMTVADINALRAQLMALGAKGVQIVAPKSVVSARPTSAAPKATSLDQSVLTFVDGSKDIPPHVDREAVKRRAAEVLNEARTVFEEA